MRPSRVQIIGLAALATVVLALVAVLLVKTNADARALASASATYTPPPPLAGTAATPTAPKPLKVAFVGDSYTAGTGADQAAHGWASLLASKRGWSATNLAKGGTGYLKEFKTGGTPACGSDACPNYLESVPAVAAAKPDVVIVAGGRNDGSTYTQALGASVTAVYAELRKALPSTKIIALSPIWGADNPEPDITQYKAGVQSAVQAVGGTYVDLGQPFEGHPDLITSDGVHPNTAGHALLASTLDQLLPSDLH